ncbi:hypothetical protein [Legionella worsleiensis]|nr:hypothetical protein [Legionella worsleiensis]
MKPEFKIERKAMRLLSYDHPDNFYLSPKLQKIFALHYSEELQTFVTACGNSIPDNHYHFILTCEESPQLIINESLHHSAMANGKKVLASGSLVFKCGDLVTITNHSGHYRPSDDEMLDVIKALHNASRGTLLEYQSYCTAEPLIYSVKELLHTASFSQVSPIASDELIHPVTGNREKSGYDFIAGDRAVVSNNRYGARLKPERTRFFEEVVNNNITSVDEIYHPASSSSPV